MQKPLAGLTRRNLVRELTAGITLLAISVPLNIGYAQIAGLPATAGLYALVLPTIVYALTVSSRQLVASPDAAAAALVASSLGGLAVAGHADYASLAMAQAIISGLAFLVLAVLKLGFVADFLSLPILVGFVGGLALDILVSQVAKMLGVPIDSGAEFIERVVQLVTGLGGADLWSVVIAAASIAVLLVGRRISRLIPWALIVLVAGTIAVTAGDLASAGVDVLGAVPAGPPAITWPVLDLGTWVTLVPSALALTMVATAEGLLVSHSYAERRGYRVDSNRDLFALGLGNIAAGASASFAIGSSTSRTAAMDQSGSRTQLPSLVLAGGTLLLLLFGTALLTNIPSPAIGAIVAVAVAPLLGVRELRQLWRMDRFEFTIGMICFATTLLVGTMAGILVAFVLSLVNLARRAANPPIDVLRHDGTGMSLLEAAESGEPTAPGLLVVRLGAPLFFANCRVFTRDVRRLVSDRMGMPGSIRHVVLDLESVTDIDVTAAGALGDLATWLAGRSIGLAYSRVPARTLQRLTSMGVRGEEAIFPTNRDAVAGLGASEESGNPGGTVVIDAITTTTAHGDRFKISDKEGNT
jgi:sulfate permease, SulP family